MNAWAVAWPMPTLAPVIIATFITQSLLVPLDPVSVRQRKYKLVALQVGRRDNDTTPDGGRLYLWSD